MGHQQWRLYCIRTYGHVCTNCADLSRDGKFVIGIGFSGYEEIALLWQACTGKVSRRFQHSRGGVLSVALSSDSEFALTGGSDGSVRIWHTISGECVEIIPSSAYFGVTVATFVS